MKRLFWWALFGGLVAYAASFIAYALPSLHPLIFWVIVGGGIALAWRDWRWGFVALLAELVLGSMGHLFFVDISGGTVSVRMALFLVLGCAILPHVYAQKLWREKSFYLPLVCWCGALSLGSIMGIVRGNDVASLWGDANGYLFWPLIFTGLFLVITKPTPGPFLPRAVAVLAGSWAASVVINGGLVYVFTHTTFEPFARALPVLYDWVRDHRLGEITRAPGGFMRVFIQGQIMSLLACGIFLLIVHGSRRIVSAGLAVAVLITSFSRSFWIGALGFMACAPFFSFGIWHQWRKKLSFWFGGLGAMLAGAGMVIVLVFFPFPAPSVDNIAQALGSRFQDGEAVASRWSLLPKMAQEIQKHPLLGSGLGAHITYKSYDPRITTTTADGTYTTYAFEWGYVDFLLKFGLIGTALLIYGLYGALKSLRCTPLAYAVLVPLCIVHAFTPYLNHPLGYGYIALALLIVHTRAVKTVLDVR